VEARRLLRLRQLHAGERVDLHHAERDAVIDEAAKRLAPVPLHNRALAAQDGLQCLAVHHDDALGAMIVAEVF
jgi:hypothetical protein